MPRAVKKFKDLALLMYTLCQGVADAEASG
jgi:hypothetical protein